MTVNGIPVDVTDIRWVERPASTAWPPGTVATSGLYTLLLDADSALWWRRLFKARWKKERRRKRMARKRRRGWA
jgi:hypothetical protein